MAETVPVKRRNPFRGIDEFYRGYVRTRILRGRKNIEGSESYEYTEGHLLEWSSGKIRSNLAKNAKKKVRFLDWGAGEGKAIHQATSINPDRVEAFGLSLIRPKTASDSQIERRIRVGEFESTVFPSFFDVIQMRFSQCYANNHVISLENALNSLRIRGELILPTDNLSHHGGRYKPPTENMLELHKESDENGRGVLEMAHPELALHDFIGEMKRQGFEISHLSEVDFGEAKHASKPRLVFPAIVIKRLTRKKADFRRFYDHPILNRIQVPPFAK